MSARLCCSSFTSSIISHAYVLCILRAYKYLPSFLPSFLNTIYFHTFSIDSPTNNLTRNKNAIPRFCSLCPVESATHTWYGLHPTPHACMYARPAYRIPQGYIIGVVGGRPRRGREDGLMDFYLSIYLSIYPPHSGSILFVWFVFFFKKKKKEKEKETKLREGS